MDTIAPCHRNRCSRHRLGGILDYHGGPHGVPEIKSSNFHIIMEKSSISNKRDDLKIYALFYVVASTLSAAFIYALDKLC